MIFPMIESAKSGFNKHRIYRNREVNMSVYKSAGILNNILEAIGDTPLVRLGQITKGLNANILVKCEHLNPSGSVKDRMAVRMIEDAEAAGKIRPGVSTISTSSSGNTAQALSMVAALKDYKVKIRFEEATAHPEKTRALDRYGATLEVMRLDDKRAEKVAKDAGLHGATIEIPGRLKCYEEEQSTPDHLWIRQFANPSNPVAQSEIGRELLFQADGKIDVFIASIGTGGTFLGVSKVLKEALPNIKCIAVQPTGWDGWVDPLSPEKKYIPNISGGIVEEIRDSGLADEIAFIGNDDAREIAYRLSREEGIYCGISSGAHVYVALQEAQKPEMKGKNIVTLIVDRGDRYITDERFIT
jgi:cysteine synthase A